MPEKTVQGIVSKQVRVQPPQNREEVIYRKTSIGRNGDMRFANRLSDVFDIKGVSFDKPTLWRWASVSVDGSTA